MALRFRRSVRLFPGVRLNLSARGVSATLGVPGLSVNVGPRGSHLNLGLPGTGIYTRQRIRAGAAVPRPAALSAAVEPLPTPQPEPETPPPSPPTTDSSRTDATVEIASVPVDQLNGDGTAVVRALVEQASTHRSETEADLQAAQRALEEAQHRLGRAQRRIFRWLWRSRIPKRQAEADAARHEVEEAQVRFEAAEVDLDFDLPAEILDAFRGVGTHFDRMAQSGAVLDVTSMTEIDRQRERSAAAHFITRNRVALDRSGLPAVRSDVGTLHFENANGEDVRVFPAVVLVGAPTGRFAVVDIRELSIAFEQVSAIGGDPPADASVIDTTWEKVNKDGTPDRRFRNNRQLPVVAYGQLTLTTPNGLRERYLVSKLDAARDFAEQFERYRAVLPARE